MLKINFDKKFIKPIKAGTKTCTIRRTEKYRVGQKIALMCGDLFIAEVKCNAVLPIFIEDDSYVVSGKRKVKSASGLQRFAEKDGFKTWRAFIKAMKGYYEIPFTGFIYEWVLIRGER